MKKGLRTFSVVALSVFAMAGCGGSNGGSEAPKSDVKVGLISVGDTTETYSKAHIDGIRAAADKLGATVNLKAPIGEDDGATIAANDLYDNDCRLIFTNSYGHQDYAFNFASSHTDCTVVADTGDYAAISGLTNYKNAFTNIYEARYVSGVVGGLKIKELEDAGKITAANKTADGQIKIGYVGAFNYAEVVSGYTAFYLGVLAGYGSDNIHMDVRYTDSWYDHDAEFNTANTFIDDNCVLVGQHADSTGAPEACERALANGKEVYSVGYNLDMLSKAPNAALTSATNNWEVYYEEAIDAFMKGEAVPTDWAKGYADNAVGITKLGPKAAEGTAAKVKEIEDQLKAGTFHVFDVSKFTVNGAHITENMVDFSYRDWSKGGVVVHQGETKNTVKTSGGVTYVEESVERSAPYFSLRIDGITEIAKAE